MGKNVKATIYLYIQDDEAVLQAARDSLNYEPDYVEAAALRLLMGGYNPEACGFVVQDMGIDTVAEA